MTVRSDLDLLLKEKEKQKDMKEENERMKCGKENM
jgi:hypothetical protein